MIPKTGTRPAQHEGQFICLFVFLIKKKSIYLFVYLFTYCVSMSTHTHVEVVTGMRRSDNNVVDLVLSSHHVSLGENSYNCGMATEQPTV